MKRRIMAFCFAALMMLACCFSSAGAAHLDADKKGSISIELKDRLGNTPVEGAEFSVYYIASVAVNSYGNLSYSYISELQECGVPLSDPQLAKRLSSILEDNEPLAVITTDSNGLAILGELELGLYLVLQKGEVEGFAPCSPFTVSVPTYVDGDVCYNVDASPKTDVARLTSITIKKIWNTDRSAEAAESVTVQLLREGEIVKTAILNKDNNWQITFEDMPESDSYSVLETNIPNGFTATYSQNGNEFTVTNTSSLIQTGQLIWPIPVLGAVGIVLLVVGFLALQRKKNDA